MHCKVVCCGGATTTSSLGVSVLLRMAIVPRVEFGEIASVRFARVLGRAVLVEAHRRVSKAGKVFLAAI